MEQHGTKDAEAQMVSRSRLTLASVQGELGVRQIEINVSKRLSFLSFRSNWNKREGRMLDLCLCVYVCLLGRLLMTLAALGAISFVLSLAFFLVEQMTEFKLELYRSETMYPRYVAVVVDVSGFLEPNPQ